MKDWTGGGLLNLAKEKRGEEGKKERERREGKKGRREKSQAQKEAQKIYERRYRAKKKRKDEAERLERMTRNVGQGLYIEEMKIRKLYNIKEDKVKDVLQRLKEDMKNAKKH